MPYFVEECVLCEHCVPDDKGRACCDVEKCSCKDSTEARNLTRKGERDGRET